MNAPRTLLAQYVRDGSEAAFRELVERYAGLVYATALRLVAGDAHLAQDVSQMVFADLARLAPRLSPAVQLGGWLHQRACHVAAPLMRAARRRQAREKEAIQMEAQESAASHYAAIAPLLDAALLKLGAADREAIALRYFERRDFRAIGESLGINEDAARMRVNRALEKLHQLLRRQGATLTLAALGTALSCEAITAAPVGLASTLALSALSTLTAPGTAVSGLSTFLEIMAKIKASTLGALILASAATSFFIQHQTQAQLRAQNEALQTQAGQMARLAAENEQLEAQASDAEDPEAELARLRLEVEGLRKSANDLNQLREENRQLLAQAKAQPKTYLQKLEERGAKGRVCLSWTSAMRDYADKHQNHYPTELSQALPYVRGINEDQLLRRLANLDPSLFEVVCHNADDIREPDWTIILREKQASLDEETGKWVKNYGFANQHSQFVAMPYREIRNGQTNVYTSFEDYERDHMVGGNP